MTIVKYSAKQIKQIAREAAVERACAERLILRALDLLVQSRNFDFYWFDQADLRGKDMLRDHDISIVLDGRHDQETKWSISFKTPACSIRRRSHGHSTSCSGKSFLIRLKDTEPLKWRINMFKDQKVLQARVSHRHFQVEFWWAKPPKTDVARLQIREYHYAVLVARTTLGALLASVHVDHLRGAEWKACHRCGRQFFR